MNQPTRIETTGSLELDDFVKAMQWFSFRKRLWLYVAYLFLILGGGLFLALTSSSRRGGGGANIGVLVSVLFVAAVVVVTIITATRFNARRQFKSTPGVALPTHYVFDEEGMTAENESANSHQRWEAFVQVHEAKTSFLLFRSNVMMQVLPKRLFRDESQIREFRALLRRRLGEKARLSIEA